MPPAPPPPKPTATPPDWMKSTTAGPPAPVQSPVAHLPTPVGSGWRSSTDRPQPHNHSPASGQSPAPPLSSGQGDTSLLRHHVYKPGDRRHNGHSVHLLRCSPPHKQSSLATGQSPAHPHKATHSASCSNRC